MEKILSLPFSYCDKEYYTLVRVNKNSQGCFELKITIMDGELESLLHGDHIFVVREGRLDESVPPFARKTAKLKSQIADALKRYFDSHPLKEHDKY